MTPDATCETVQENSADLGLSTGRQPDAGTPGRLGARALSWFDSLEHFAPFGQLMCPGWAA